MKNILPSGSSERCTNRFSIVLLDSEVSSIGCIGLDIEAVDENAKKIDKC